MALEKKGMVRRHAKTGLGKHGRKHYPDYRMKFKSMIVRIKQIK